MTKATQSIATLLVFLAFSLPLVAQYTSTTTTDFVSNLSHCGSAGCLTSIGGVITDGPVVGVDSTIWALAGTGLWKYVPGSGWSMLPTALQTAGGHLIHHIALARANVAVALVDPSFAPNIYVLNSAGTAWVQLSSGVCLDAEIGVDGVSASPTALYCIGTDAHVYRWSGSGWNYAAGDVTNLAVGSSAAVWGVNASGVLENYKGAGVWATVPVSGFTPAHGEKQIAVTDAEEGGDLLLVVDTAGNVHVSSDGAGTWSTILGPAAMVGSGGFTLLFTQSPSGVSYHINSMVPQVTNTESGTWNCPVGPGCPAGSFHTLVATAKFGGSGGAHGTAGVTAQTQGYPTNYLNVIAQEQASGCDLFFGDPTSPNCADNTGGTATCSVMGMLQTFGGGNDSWIPVGWAVTAGTFTGTPTYWAPTKQILCSEKDACTSQFPTCHSISPVKVDWPSGTPPTQSQMNQICSAHSPWLTYQPTFKFGTTTVCVSDKVDLLYPFLRAIPTYGTAPIPYPCTTD